MSILACPPHRLLDTLLAKPIGTLGAGPLWGSPGSSEEAGVRVAVEVQTGSCTPSPALLPQAALSGGWHLIRDFILPRYILGGFPLVVEAFLKGTTKYTKLS